MKHFGTFDEFTAQMRAILEPTAAGKGYSTTGVDGENALYEFVQETANGPGHALGEIIYKARRYGAKGDPVDVLKIASWAFLVWRHHQRAVPEVSADVPDSAAKEWVETREPTVTVGAPFVQVIEWPQTASITTTSPGLQDGSYWHYNPATDRSQMTYDEKRAELHQCRCGRMVHSDTACDNAGKCLAGLHPHAKPLT